MCTYIFLSRGFQRLNMCMAVAVASTDMNSNTYLINVNFIWNWLQYKFINIRYLCVWKNLITRCAWKCDCWYNNSWLCSAIIYLGEFQHVAKIAYICDCGGLFVANAKTHTFDFDCSFSHMLARLIIFNHFSRTKIKDTLMKHVSVKKDCINFHSFDGRQVLYLQWLLLEQGKNIKKI